MGVLVYTTTLAIEINYVNIPNAVKNNTYRPALLDCNYSIRPDDTELVVQWYLNEDLVYQWIPPRKPQSLGILKDRVDLTYKATDDPKTVYRAIKINNPTTDIAGEYKCLVSTLGDHDSRMKNMIVFEPEKHLTITRTMDSKYVNFTCFVSGVFPTPKLLLYKDITNEFNSRIRISITEWDLKRDPNIYKYSMFIVGTERVTELEPGTLIHCELKIPGTGYVKQKSLLYYPEYIVGIGKYIRRCRDNSYNQIFVLKQETEKYLNEPMGQNRIHFFQQGPSYFPNIIPPLLCSGGLSYEADESVPHLVL